MKPLTQQELDQLVSYFSPILSGAQLQEVLVNDRGLALGFQGDRRYWMILDLVPNSPMLLIFEEQCPFRKSVKSKPVALFLSSHGKNLYFTSMTVQTERGRLILLKLQNAYVDCDLEIRLIPKQCNVIVTARFKQERNQVKQISWDRPLPLSPAPVVENPPAPRTLVQIHEEWLAEQKTGQKSSLDPEAQWEKQKQKDLEKKRKALSEIQKQIDSDKAEIWYEAGQFLKAEGRLSDLPENLQDLIQPNESLSWNIENCFAKAKQLIAKKEGARQRRDELINEIEKLERTRFSVKNKKEPLSDLMRKAEARGRKLPLESGALAYCGKSAADNLALLRQAKAWDYWLHLRDYPGAHAIIHRQREQLISDTEIQQVAAWVARESLSSKSLMLGQKVGVVIVECRFVRPIKGDKLGRVTYHSEKSLSFILE